MLLAPSFIWLIGDATTLSYEIEASKQRVPLDRGVAAVNGMLGLIPNSRFLGEPADGKNIVKSLGQQVFVRHELNDDWSLQGGVSYRGSSLRGISTQLTNIQADGRSAWRQRRDNNWNGIDRSGRFEIVGKFATGSVGLSKIPEFGPQQVVSNHEGEPTCRMPTPPKKINATEPG